jgi:DNA-binding GntR family transcriptional regulator
MTQTPRASGMLQDAIGADPTDAIHMLSERVYRSILRLVHRGQLKGGAPLRIDELSRILNVSPTPVREGLARLAATGLVIHEPRKGFRVAPPLTGNQFDLLMDARELLEVGAAGLALATGNPDFVPALREALVAQEAASRAFYDTPADAADFEEAEWAVLDADLAFHHVVFQFTNNPFMTLMADSLNGQSHRQRQQADRGVSDSLEALAEHTAIVRAAESGDRGAIESAMRMHLRLVRARARSDMAAPREDTS